MPRRHHDFNHAAEELTQRLFRFASLGRRDRIMLRNSVEALSQSFDWSQLAPHYHQVHDLALERVGG